jgi:alanine racemase
MGRTSMSTAPDLSLFRPTVADIDVGAFRRNLSNVASALPAGSRLIAVLKADAYGHGAAELASRAVGPETAMIAVALLEEALELRDCGIDGPILVLGPLLPAQIAAAIAARITIGVVGPEELETVCSLATDRVAIHLKLDSGMGRMGLVRDDLGAAIEVLRRSPNVRVEALYTHFANASDPADPFTGVQTERFDAMVATLRTEGIEAALHHLANSAATARGLVRPGDLVRVGIGLYGAEPLDYGGKRLAPVLRWSTRIERLKELPAGEGIGYGTTFHTTRPSRIATLPVGYADGYDRSLSNAGEVLVCGRRAPVVGRVSMDLVTIDVTDIRDANLGDEVVLLGVQGDEEISAEELAGKTDTISYEVFCRISSRVPRVYHDADGTAVRSKFIPAIVNLRTPPS